MLIKSIHHLIFIIYCIKFLLKRSEETIIAKPKRTLYPCFNQNPITWKCFSSYFSLFQLLVTRQTLAYLLSIGNVERNPGPENPQVCKRCLLPASCHLCECSVCFRDFSVTDIDLPLFAYHYTYKIKGRFIFICSNCSDAYVEQESLSKIEQDCSEKAVSEQAIVNDHSNPQRRSPETNNKWQQTQSRHNKNYCCYNITPLMSLTLIPPRAKIFLKWIKLLDLHNATITKRSESPQSFVAANKFTKQQLVPLINARANLCNRQTHFPTNRSTDMLRGNPYLSALHSPTFSRLAAGHPNSQQMNSSTRHSLVIEQTNGEIPYSTIHTTKHNLIKKDQTSCAVVINKRRKFGMSNCKVSPTEKNKDTLNREFRNCNGYLKSANSKYNRVRFRALQIAVS